MRYFLQWNVLQIYYIAFAKDCKIENMKSLNVDKTIFLKPSSCKACMYKAKRRSYPAEDFSNGQCLIFCTLYLTSESLSHPEKVLKRSRQRS